ncbi:transglutaminase-like cysteine peptidase [Sulfurospirillum arcachonense]|uniref:transglutaminase-like cysteine peptidase n=1 Tax=Sulfurospirillum arcachonense TaxID=57666 RepID=UPI0004AD9EE2|nr:transglutaminase-like cysteine peptidase [Sulfurospirillum arcachonense]
MNLQIIIKILFFLVLCLTNINSAEFYLNPYFEKKIQKDTKSFHILKNYVAFMNTLVNLDKNSQIQKINTYLNAIIPRYDAYNYKNEEYWATPFEFLSRGGGDCEDYVIAKRYSLKKLGFSTKDMYLSVVKEKYTGGDHMVLSLHVNKNSPPLVLDNLSTKVLSFDKRVDLKLNFMFNDFEFFTLKDYKTFIKINKINLPAYEKMKTRDNQELILKR